ncbi:MAG TPA: hypothetical protein VF661_08720 [Actinomycetales bacterium]|jgi:hypothetical protein
MLDRLGRRIDDDFGPAGLPPVRFLDQQDWDTEVPSIVQVEQEPTADATDVVCVCGGRSFLVHLHHGLESAVAAVASALQDDVMDQLNRPWPVAAGGAVLQPAVDRSGLAVWATADGVLRCPVGYLGLLDPT